MIFNATDIHSVYIHWPFCPYRCNFCPFVALAGQDEFMHMYHTALLDEMRFFHKSWKGTSPINTIFFGGGTPSTYPNALFIETVSLLRKLFVWNDSIEITIEVNPGTVKEEQVRLWKSIGINRLSVGVQSLKDNALHALNRLQSKEDVRALMSFAPSYIENISVDLIMGLPGVSFDEWQQYITEIMTWPIKHISIYFLTLHEDTRLYFDVLSERVVLPSDEYMVRCYKWTYEFLFSNGFAQYELSNFSKEGYHSRHNSAYWDRKVYKGFGLGACSFDGKRRMQNEKNLTKYAERVSLKEEPVVFEESLNDQQIRLEKLMLGMRRSQGVSWADVCIGFDEDKIKQVQENIKGLVIEGFISFNGNILTLTQKGMVVENQVIARLSL